MSTTTTNLGLTKTISSETMGTFMTAMNGSGGNLDIIDTAVGKINTAQRTIQQFSSATAGSKFTTTSFRAYAVGNMVIAYGTVTATATYGSSDVLLTINSALVPTRTETSAVLTVDRSGTILTMPSNLQINTNGEITETYSASSGVSGDKISFLFIYLINNTNNPYT